MKFLFYTDPHIIRQDPYVYEHVLRRMGHLLSREAADRPRGCAYHLLTTKHQAEHLHSAVSLPDAVNRKLFEINPRWDHAGIELWRQLMAGEGTISEVCHDILLWLYKKYHFDGVIYWGTNGAIRRFAEDFGLYSAALELGPTRKPFFETAYLDPFGVNGDAYSAQLSLDDVEPVDFDRLWCGLPFCYSEGDVYDWLFRPITSTAAELIYDGRGKNVLIPLQLDDDSNCILHSRFSGMFEMVRETVPMLVDAGYRVFVKPHPAAHPNHSQGRLRPLNVTAHEQCRQFLSAHVDPQSAVWVEDISAQDYLSFLDKMDAVVTVNSSVGFEALLLGKTVVPLGKAPYNIAGSLPELAELTSGSISRDDYLGTAGRIARLMLGHYLYPMDILDHKDRLDQAMMRGVSIWDHFQSGGMEAVDRYVKTTPTVTPTPAFVSALDGEDRTLGQAPSARTGVSLQVVG